MPFFAGPRCIVLAGDGQGGYRLWQYVSTAHTLRERLETALNAGAPVLAETLRETMRLLIHAIRSWSNEVCELPLSLGAVSAGATGPKFAGFMPYPILPRASAAARDQELIGIAKTELEFASSELRRMRTSIVDALTSHAGSLPRSRTDSADIALDKLLATI